MNRLKELRKEKGLTQKELADRMNISKITILRWENGERDIKSNKASELADYFGVSLGILLGYTHKQNSFGFFLRTLRMQRGIELEKAANDLRLSVDELKEIESTDNGKLGDVLAKTFADYYDVPVAYLQKEASFMNINLGKPSSSDFILASHLPKAITETINEKNMPLVYDFLRKEFEEKCNLILNDGINSLTEEETKKAVDKAIINTVGSFWNLPDNLVKLILYWATLKPSERIKLLELIKVLSLNNLGE